MKTNAAGIALIKEFEKLSLTPYLCPAGKPTLGWGHTAGVTMQHPPITRMEAEAYLAQDVAVAERIVTRAVTVPLTENQFSALVSFAFNVGPGKAGYRDGFVALRNGRPSTMLFLLNDWRFEAAAQEFAKWNKGGGRVLNGLIRRRAAEKALFLKHPKAS